MMRPILLLAVFSLASCAKIPKPVSDLCVQNAPAKHMKCYNLARDYNDDGSLKATAKPTFKPYETTFDGNKFISIDPDSWANLKAYIKLLRVEYEKGCQN